MSIHKVRNVQRVLACIDVTIELMRYAAVSKKAAARIGDFFTHPYPAVRMSASEALYVALQCRELNETQVESLLLNTPWSTGADNDLVQAAAQIVACCESYAA